LTGNWQIKIKQKKSKRPKQAKLFFDVIPGGKFAAIAVAAGVNLLQP